MIQWEIKDKARLPVKSWCGDIDDGALKQALNLANHPVVTRHVALMPDAHVGYGMPIGGVIACRDALIPNAVGVDIGCGMGAVKTNLTVESFTDKSFLRGIIGAIKARIPVGEGNARKHPAAWEGFHAWRETLAGAVLPGWYAHENSLDQRNLGTLGGGNHFIEIQRSDEGEVWLMLHSGSRNLGYRVANYYHREALKLNKEMGIQLPDPQLAYLPRGNPLCEGYIRDMNYALSYAAENRRLMMEELKIVMAEAFAKIEYSFSVNIHHNYAAEEEHGGELVWIHRKGATSARAGEPGIIPGSMGTSSYIVEGRGNEESFSSCSHGAGRRMGRAQACRSLTTEECDRAMDGVVFDRWTLSDVRDENKKKLPDLSEAPPAYKDIDAVIEAELDLIKPLVRLRPLAVVKG